MKVNGYFGRSRTCIKRLLFLALLAFLSTVSVKAQQADSCLVVWHKNGSQVTFNLYERPKIIINGNSVIVESSETVQYDFKDIRKMTFIPKKHIKGDVNGDKFVNVADLHDLVSIILAGYYNEAGDINEDGYVNIVDVTSIIPLLNDESLSDDDIIEQARRMR